MPRRVTDPPAPEAPVHALRRLASRGAGALETTELLQILLAAGGCGGRPAARYSRVLEESGGLPGLLEAVSSGPRPRLLNRREAARLAASFELGRRLERRFEQSASAVRGPEDASRVVVPHLRGQLREIFGILPLDTRGRSTGFRLVSVGSLSASIVHPREVFAEAIRARAAAIVVAHNHPSGDPEPSPEDLAVTRKLVSSGDLLGIPVLDHLIVGHAETVSLERRGLLAQPEAGRPRSMDWTSFPDARG